MDIEANFTNNNQTNKFIVRTKFSRSVCFLLWQALLPGLTLFFLTSYDFSFSFHIALAWMFCAGAILLLITTITTFIGYKLSWHNIDQFTYTIPFIFLIFGFYISSYWLGYQYFLLRFVIAFVAAIVGSLFISLIILFFVRRKAKTE